MRIWAWVGPALSLSVAQFLQTVIIANAERARKGATEAGPMDKESAVGIRAYHNERIYYNFELFMKLMFAVAGGLGFLAFNKGPGSAGFAQLELPAMLVVGTSGFLIAWLILLHEARKISTSHRRFGTHWLIGDRYMFFGIVLITSIMVWVFVPAVFHSLPVPERTMQVVKSPSPSEISAAKSVPLK